MKKKVLGLDKNGIQKTLRLKNYFGDGSGQIALNIISGLVGQLAYFYTDKIGLAATMVGTMLLIPKIFDAFTDLIMGYFVDRTNTKWGKARPWLLWSSIPAGLSVVALFAVPSMLGTQGTFYYGLISNSFATAIMFTMIAIPYGCMLSYVTKSTEERGTMGIYRALFGYIVGMIIAIALIPITNALGGDQSAWIKVGAVFGVIVTGSLILTFFANKEQSSVLEYSDEEKLPFMQSLGYLLSNKYWVIMLVVMVLVNIIYAVAGASGIYYAKWVLKDENLIALLGGIGLIPVFIGFPLTGYMSKKFGQSGAIRVSLIIGIIGTIIRGIFPTNLPIMLTASVFSTFGTIPLMAIGGVLVNNTVEYGVWKYNKRIVGMTNSASSFGGKISGGLGAAMLGWVLGAMGYVGTAVAQPQSAITGILIVSIWIPLALMIGILVAMLFYDLDDKFPMIMKELEVRKAQNESH